MASNYWIKLYHEILDDAKMGKLSDRLWRRTIELFLMAGDNQQDGELPSLQQMAWRLRTSDETLQAELDELEQLGIVTMNGEIQLVTNFEKRQSAMDGSERMSRLRAKKRKDDYYSDSGAIEDVTIRHIEENRIDIEENRIDKDKNMGDKQSAELIFFNELQAQWVKSFPLRTKPRHSKSIAGKLKTRMTEPHFRDNWRAAMKRGAKSNYLGDKETTWFDLLWFLKNDSNYENCLNGKYDFKPYTKRTPPPAEANADAQQQADDIMKYKRGQQG